MNSRNTGVANESSVLPLEYTAAGDGTGAGWAAVTAFIRPLGPLFAVAAAALLLCSAVTFALGGWHVSKLPDSFGRQANPAQWTEHFGPQVFYSRIALLTLFGGLAAIALWRWDRTVAVLRAFWFTVMHPMNLAIYRIVLFATILFNLDNDSNYAFITYFASFPRELFIPPTGMEYILPILPVNPALAWWSLTLMNVFCITAILGFYSRTSAWLVILFGLYALGIPQYFGQTNHYHHMFWFAAVAAVAPIGDYLSIDAILRARRRAQETGETEAPPPSRAYGLPLRFILILIGICYFFPGLWKYWVSGLGWAFSDNFKHLMEWKWINMGLAPDISGNDWQPMFRLDHYPWLYKPSAMIALIFEMSFIILIFFPRARYLAILMGVGFHRMIHFMMRIPFYTLQTSYVAAFEWDKIFGWVSRKVFSRPTVVVFDGANEGVRKTIAGLRSLDLMGPDAVKYVDATDRDALAAAGVRFDRSAGVQAFVGETVVSGAAAYRAAARRNPALWPVFPALFLLPDPAKAGDAEGSGTPVPAPAYAAVPVRAGRPWRYYSLTPIMVTFLIVLAPNLFLGFTRRYHAWPFSCYPLFEKIRGHEKTELDVVALDADGNVIPWDERGMREKMTTPRYATLCRRIREMNNPEQLHAFWEVLSRANPQLRDAKVVQFYETKMLSAPEDWGKPPRMRLVHQAALTEDGIVPQVRVTSVEPAQVGDE